MAVHRIDVELVRPGSCNRPTGNTETRHRVIHEGVAIGIWRVPMCSAARWLVENGAADRTDVLEMWRGDTRCMVGSIGWLADHTVSENDSGDAVARFSKFKPFALSSRGGCEENRPSEIVRDECLEEIR